MLIILQQYTGRKPISRPQWQDSKRKVFRPLAVLIISIRRVLAVRLSIVHPL